MSEIGERIQLLRRMKAEEVGHCTQADLGKVLGLSVEQIGKMETKGQGLSAKRIIALAEYFDVSCDYLLRGGHKDHLKLMNQTGLSDESINILSEINENPLDYNAYIITALNAMITDPKLLDLLGQYFCTDFEGFHFWQNGKPVKVTAEWLAAFDPFVAEVGLEPIGRIAISDRLKKLREDFRNGKS